ncbi:MAG: HAD family hydrolase [Dehalococcoidia bacterium]|nr:HAD family hydrolase [Dehalococcoidia bacterium]
MPIRAVFFDVGETLIDETRIWEGWADWLSVPHLTFMGALGGLIERGEHHQRVLELFRPGFDLEREEAARAAAGVPNVIDPSDLYPDVLPCLEALRNDGYLIGVAGNQPEQTETVIRTMGLPVDVIASSARWGIEKPSPAFFARIAKEVALPPNEIAYVGDRLDNDVLPAVAARMVAVFLRRGPWGYLHALRPEADQAHIRLDALAELPDALRQSQF